MGELASRGHEVTVISPFLPKKPVKNYETIQMDGMLKLMEGELDERKFREKLNSLITLNFGPTVGLVSLSAESEWLCYKI